jgi:hypothetical protein
MQQEVSRRVAEVSGRVFWSTQEIKDALNAGLMEISDACEWNETYVEFDLLNDRPYYDVRTLIGENVLSIKPSFDEQTNRWLIPSGQRQLDQHDRRWERVTGEPQRVFTRGLFWLGLFPRSQSDVGTIKQYYTALPDPLDDDDDEPGFSDTFHSAIVEYALTDLWAQDAETTWALTAWASYLAGEAGLRAWVQGRAGDAIARGFDSPMSSVQR